ncbi:transglutaminaseTgpA domain-containing protein [Lentzea sp. BCCO 10_0061]|uniref:TransglutaminaseTgpA domain-containing protein n=1 Tax=Lentzea sokolovensis TaxID=3095429 RepID=A0ABU4V7Q4_9PSEU|nr:transglutaminaseTgpA domain-containing protein [Lentzea sp. BCCO 10_0061]MDX8147822.1 transglutaminaseTgpA domain-containing protein [Lentzea sp. BCCO 10_0061]
MTKWLARIPALLQILLCGLLVASTSAIYLSFFASSDHVMPMCAIAALATASAAIAHLARRGWVVLGAVPVFGVCAGYLAFPDTIRYGLPSVRTAVELGKGLAGGWARMLTVGLPADVRGDLLTTPLLITWAAAFGAALIALRTTSVLGPLAPPVAAFVIALLFSAESPGPRLDVTGVFLALALLLVLMRANEGPAVSLRVAGGRFVFGVPVIALVTAAGVVGVQWVPLASGVDRFDPRDLRSPPLHVTESITPLALVKPQLREAEARTLFTVELDGDGVDRVRTAALDRYDGALWTTETTFLLAGRSLPADPDMPPAGQLTSHVVVSRLQGPYLPVVGWPRSVVMDRGDSSATGFSAGTGSLINLGSFDGIEYRTTSTVSGRGDEVDTASPSACGDCATLTVPPELRTFASAVTTTAPTAYGKLQLLERHLRGLPYSLDAAPGHSVAVLRDMLLGEDRRGYAEQHAAAFALLARVLGMPSRVAVGYLLRESENRTFTVTAGDAHAWAEVHFKGHGWVAFEPTDPAVTEDKPRDDDATTVSPPQPDPPPLVPPAASPDNREEGAPGLGFGELVRRTAVVTLIVLMTVVLVFLGGVVGTKRRRRWRRRRTADPAARLLGAWQEAVDRLLELGLRIPLSMTVHDIGDVARTRFGDRVAALATMAPMASAAAFAGVPPSDDDVTFAWELESDLRRELHPRRLSRIRAAIDPRPLIDGRRARRAGGR